MIFLGTIVPEMLWMKGRQFLKAALLLMQTENRCGYDTKSCAPKASMHIWGAGIAA